MQDKADGFSEEAKGATKPKLCGTDLPWVKKVKHLGNTISNTMDGNQLDMQVKTARYIDKNNTICQEFYFAHPKTKAAINNIYNGHFTGSQLWKIGTKEYRKVESTFNKSVKIMYDLPWATHRYFMEPLVGSEHVSRILAKRYLSFIDKIRKSGKSSIIQLLDIVKKDARLTTGYNLRSIMILAGKNRVEDLEVGKVDFEYHKVEETEAWRIDFVQELIDLRYGDLHVPGMDVDELKEILDYICTS